MPGKYLGVANWAKGGWEVSAQSGESELSVLKIKKKVNFEGCLSKHGYTYHT